MRPLDPRLLRHVAPARGHVVLSAALGVLTAALVVTQALLLAAVLAPLVLGDATLEGVAHPLAGLAVVMVSRAVLTGVQERFARRAALRVVADLRAQVVAHLIGLDPRLRRSLGVAEVAATATRGLDDLEPYVVRYLPQLLLAVTVTPGALAVVAGLDLVAAVTIVVTLPLVPVFMVLIGRMTQEHATRRLAAMERLSGQVLDLLAGLPTLRRLGREHGPGQRVRALGDAHRRATMGTLRIAFLSGAVLELLTTLSVALVAVGVGFRLVDGALDLRTALAVLVLAPEVYLPLRQVGAHFHASADGLAAADRAFALLSEPVPARSTGHRVPAPDLRRHTLLLVDVGVRTAGRSEDDAFAPDGLDLQIRPGTVTALVGPNGSGKSTALDVLLGLTVPERGQVLLRDTDVIDGDPSAGLDLRTVDLPSYWEQVAWVPQRPVLEPGTLREVVLRGADVPDDALAAAAALTGLDSVVAGLPAGWATAVGQGGAGLSLGERQRAALTRALVRDTAVVVLDEPTAHLDAESERAVLASVAELRRRGRTVLLVAHRPALVALADQVVPVRSTHVASPVVVAAGR